MGLEMKLERFTFDGVPEQRPLVISGPCSAESEEQVIQTAKELSDVGIKLFRAGIWKPRTRPNSFEGLGSVALPWLKKVKDELGMYTAIEVANVKHVYEALKFGIDILWLGARTTANPFAVQEIADTLRGMNIPVLIKNPVNPDVELWIGAIERLYNAGITKLAVIHRGFSSFQDTIFRNHPQWQLPIEIRRRLPEIPIITDPSHICGNREMLYQVSQKAMDLNFDGLIIESHINPEKALSDSKQQVTPRELKQLLDKLVVRTPEVENGLMLTLEELRAQIDKLDNELLKIFEKRMKIADEIGTYKKKNNIAILQTKRWDEILKRHTAEGQKMGLSEEFTKRIFYAIHQESINHQENIMLRDE